MPSAAFEPPAPSAEALAHSGRVADTIRSAIVRAGGAIPFSAYMRLALYAPGLGYYQAGAEKFGAGGDFVTAPELSPLFGHVVGRQLAEILARTEGDTVLELGAGSGRLALSGLRALAQADRLPRRYLILEPSAELAARQKALLADETPLVERIEWLERLPQHPIRGVILANEVADALPVERFRRRGGRLVRMGVRAAGDGFAWTELPAPAWLEERVEALAARYDWPDDYASEVCLDLAPWTKSLAAVLERGVVLLLDYGLPEREYYHAQRSMGTLVCHYRHRAHDDPFLWPGLQDLSAWVDFSALARAGRAAGLALAGFATQAHFLLAGGIGEALATARDERERLRLAGEIQRLVLPAEMGEAFKALALARDAPPPSAFGFRDLAAHL